MQVQLFVGVQLGVVLQLHLDVVPRNLQLAQKNALVLGHRQDQLPLVVRNGLRLRLREVHVDAGLQHRRRDHEDDEQNQHDVHQRRHVDLGDGAAHAAAAAAHRHG